jgi:A/G-specific adenine glycosylase
LVSAGPEAAQWITQTLGLHWRGPLLYSTAERVAAGGGVPPMELDALRGLPGVGPYAAAAWLSLHQGKRAVIVDNNVARLLSRLEGVEYDAETRRKRWVYELADLLTPVRAFRTYNYAVLDFTMAVCRPRAPLCPQCPLLSDCNYGRATVCHD